MRIGGCLIDDMAKMVPHNKPYAAVKCFWCESSGRFALKKMMEGGKGWEIVGIFGSKKEAEAASDKLWSEPHEGMWSTTIDMLVRLPDGTEMPTDELPPGAMFDAEWRHEELPMEDGITLMVVLPNGMHWCVDSQCSNCTKPDDKVHTCWVRRGDPRTGMVHVERKEGDDTCAAGASSIMVLDPDHPKHYHGHLQKGWLTAG